MYDKIEYAGSSLIQHGKMNNRIYLMKYSPKDEETIFPFMNKLLSDNSYDKIFCKVPASSADLFFSEGFLLEAYIPEFYIGKEDVLFMSKYFGERASVPCDQMQIIKDNINIANEKKNKISGDPLPGKFSIRPLKEENAPELTEVYKEVFKTYPFPIHEPDYIIKTMRDNIFYFGVFEDGKLAAASSAESDLKSLNAEMTDFATLPEYRGNGLALYLLHEMEKFMIKKGFLNLYTIARAFSAGMNITFAKAGYNFSGTLINNTDISGRIESMNVWYRLVNK